MIFLLLRTQFIIAWKNNGTPRGLEVPLIRGQAEQFQGIIFGAINTGYAGEVAQETGKSTCRKILDGI